MLYLLGRKMFQKYNRKKIVHMLTIEPNKCWLRACVLSAAQSVLSSGYPWHNSAIENIKGGWSQQTEAWWEKVAVSSLSLWKDCRKFVWYFLLGSDCTAICRWPASDQHNKGINNLHIHVKCYLCKVSMHVCYVDRLPDYTCTTYD